MAMQKRWRSPAAVNQATRDIMDLLKIDTATAEQVQYRMGEMGLDFSKCTPRAFNKCAREAHAEHVRTVPERKAAAERIISDASLLIQDGIVTRTKSAATAELIANLVREKKEVDDYELVNMFFATFDHPNVSREQYATVLACMVLCGDLVRHEEPCTRFVSYEMCQ